MTRAFRTKGKGDDRQVYPIQERRTFEKSIPNGDISKMTVNDLKFDARNIMKQLSSVSTVDQMLLQMRKYTGLLGTFSPFNSVLIHMQDPDATIVRSKVEWKRFGRDVEADAKPIMVLYPVGAGKKYMPGQIKEFIEKKRKEGYSDEMIESMVREKFRNEISGSVYVFGNGKVYDISQTERIKGHDAPPEVEVRRANVLYDALKGIAGNYYKIEEGQISGARGYTAHSADSEALIRVMKVPGEDPEALHTLIHEVSHARLEHLKSNSKETYGINEAEAELSTYLVGEHYGMNFMHDSAAYIKSWLSGKNLGEEQIDRAMNNAHWMISEIDGKLRGNK